MIRTAILGIGRFGFLALQALPASYSSYFLGQHQQMQALSQKHIQKLSGRTLSGFANSCDIISLIGNPLEKDFGPLLAEFAKILKTKDLFVSALVPQTRNQPPFDNALKSLGEYANCILGVPNCGTQQRELLLSPDSVKYILKGIEIFRQPLNANMASMDLCDLKVLFQGQLYGRIFSAYSSGCAPGLDAAHALAISLSAWGQKKLSSTLIHFFLPDAIPQTEIIECCQSLRDSFIFKAWLFSVDLWRDSQFRTDMLATIHL